MVKARKNQVKTKNIFRSEILFSFISVLGMKSLYSKESSDVGAALSYYSPKLDFWLLVYINY